jgi:hypothetical protein
MRIPVDRPLHPYTHVHAYAGVGVGVGGRGAERLFQPHQHPYASLVNTAEERLALVYQHPIAMMGHVPSYNPFTYIYTTYSSKENWQLATLLYWTQCAYGQCKEMKHRI